MGKIEYTIPSDTEERCINATHTLVKLITDGDPMMEQYKWQVIKHPMDEIANRRYWQRKAELIELFISTQFNGGGHVI